MTNVHHISHQIEPHAPMNGAQPASPAPVLLRTSLVATLALAPLEGYLQHINSNLGKVAPALLMLAWIANRVRHGKPIGVSHPVVWCCLALLALVLASTAIHLDNGHALHYLIRWLPFLVLVIALVDVLSKDVDPWTAIHAFVLGAVVSACGALISFSFLGAPRATGPLSDSNDLAYILTAAAPMALLSAQRAADRVRAGIWGCVVILLLVASAATFSRGGAVATVAVVIWALARHQLPARFIAVGTAIFIVVLTPVRLFAGDLVTRALLQKDYIATSNVDTRLLRWHAAARMLGDHLLMGVGPGGFSTHYVEYSHFAELVLRTPINGEIVAHEMYLEVGAELGLVALVVFLAAILGAFVASENAIRRRRDAFAGTRDPRLLAALAVQGSLVAVIVSSVFLSEQYYLPLWAGLSIAAALDHRTRVSLS